MVPRTMKATSSTWFVLDRFGCGPLVVRRYGLELVGLGHCLARGVWLGVTPHSSCCADCASPCSWILLVAFVHGCLALPRGLRFVRCISRLVPTAMRFNSRSGRGLLSVTPCGPCLLFIRQLAWGRLAVKPLLCTSTAGWFPWACSRPGTLFGFYSRFA